MKTIKYIILNFIPILIMIGLIPIIKNDYFLALAYIVIIAVSFAIKMIKRELLIFIVGFVALTFSETIFVSTGVETFTRRSLFNLMPLWLPLLWGYSFVAIKRAVLLLDAQHA